MRHSRELTHECGLRSQGRFLITGLEEEEDRARFEEDMEKSLESNGNEHGIVNVKVNVRGNTASDCRRRAYA